MQNFESIISSLILSGASSRKEAIQWLIKAEVGYSERDQGYGLWCLKREFNLPDDYFEEKR